MIRAVCYGPPGSAFWPPDDPCAAGVVWPLRSTRRLVDSGVRRAASVEATATVTVPCGRALFSDDRTLIVAS